MLCMHATFINYLNCCTLMFSEMSSMISSHTDSLTSNRSIHNSLKTLAIKLQNNVYVLNFEKNLAKKKKKQHYVFFFIFFFQQIHFFFFLQKCQSINHVCVNANSHSRLEFFTNKCRVII